MKKLFALVLTLSMLMLVGCNKADGIKNNKTGQIKDELAYDISDTTKNDATAENTDATKNDASITSDNTAVTTEPAKSKITKDEAKAIALKHAKISSADVRNYKIELGFDDDRGIWEYEIEFNANGFEYDYEISASNGKILQSEKEFND